MDDVNTVTAEQYSERELYEEEVKEILSTIRGVDDITDDLLKVYFAKFKADEEPRFNTNDYFKLPIGSCCKNKKEGYTTIGLYIFNKFIIEPEFSDLFGYINKAITGPMLEDIEDKIAKGVYEGRIPTDHMKEYLNKIQWLGGNDICCIISPSLSPGILKPPEGMLELKEDLKKKYKKEIAAGDPIAGAKIESELIKYAEEKLKDDTGFENFLSKAKASVGNNYKNMNINEIVSPYSNIWMKFSELTNVRCAI